MTTAIGRGFLSFNEKLFIEIYVSNPVGYEKMNSGNRIIEIKINNENDLNIFFGKVLSINNDNIKSLSGNKSWMNRDNLTPYDNSAGKM